MHIDEIKIGRRHRVDLGDIAGLAASIAELGLLHPVVVTPDGKLIAGERRLAACRSLGWTDIPVTVVDLAEIVRGEFAENCHRKDFLPSEIDAIRRVLEPLERAKAKERQIAAHASPGKFPEHENGQVRDKIGAFAGVSGRTVQKIAAVVDAAKAEPERFGRLLEDMDRTRRVNGVFRRLRVARQAELLRREPVPLPGNGPYRVIVVDPPWPNYGRDDFSRRGMADLAYPTMSVDDIKALDVASLAHEDAVLWLWTTNAYMREAHEIAIAWGFTPKTILTWAKNKMSTGDWLRGQTEHAIMAVRGHPIVTLSNQTTLLHAPVREHSVKPTDGSRFATRA